MVSITAQKGEDRYRHLDGMARMLSHADTIPECLVDELLQSNEASCDPPLSKEEVIVK